MIYYQHVTFVMLPILEIIAAVSGNPSLTINGYSENTGYIVTLESDLLAQYDI